ncbi:NAD-dependent succinate-semialdehyde dehydrogenase [Aeromicrobium sp. YIM 150415]|uniref:NAD-dependent succinate-semialdehyde dehydrogenase n=1 Tax=Aeromicrobium sp. YIM 150415 TaxID=2803912 RepID=UPI0019651526|nr:NAD-dependent succinate-semialdehyde dehydrogenase [Aeromicrobium sp. YIM 150415]MBM9464095.1 NAD-dependent succinate-semialdehyde dehydrogenase [Aeromicrobium sp. YIM 150415]
MEEQPTAARTDLFIDGDWRAGRSGEFDVLDPASGAVISRISDGDELDGRAAVDAAAAALPGWTAMAPRDRSEILRRAFELMIRDRESLAALISSENGKSIADARGEVTYAAEFFRWFAEEGVRSAGDFGRSPGGDTRTVVTHKPVGVVALVTPWNFPAAMATRKLAPALAAGCTAVLKPASETPLTTLAITRLLVEAGLPRGVVNVVPTKRSSALVSSWLDDPRIRKLSFTGSTEVGRVLLKRSADRILNTSMELGGNAPFVITDDADLDVAVEAAMTAKFRGSGQACTAANRFYVHVDVATEFAQRFGDAVEKLSVGPASGGHDVGPLISERAVAEIGDLVDQALAAGARVGRRAMVPQDGGFYFPPTVLVDVAADARVVATEVFGPVAPIVTWNDQRELLRMVNDTEMGLAAYVIAGDLGRAMRLAEGIDAGMVGINRGLVSDPSAPFGGMKQSGIGREGARAGLDEFLETQYFSIAWAD